MTPRRLLVALVLVAVAAPAIAWENPQGYEFTATAIMETRDGTRRIALAGRTGANRIALQPMGAGSVRGVVTLDFGSTRGLVAGSVRVRNLPPVPCLPINCCRTGRPFYMTQRQNGMPSVAGMHLPRRAQARQGEPGDLYRHRRLHQM